MTMYLFPSSIMCNVSGMLMATKSIEPAGRKGYDMLCYLLVRQFHVYDMHFPTVL